jgi:murein DD-endopeptidase MepM/ murein hydrolase activator NlpD
LVKNIRIFFAKCRLYLSSKWHGVKQSFSSLTLPRWMQNRKTLMAAYVLVMVGLAGVWWVNSPYRLQNNPYNSPIVSEDPADTEDPTSPAPDPVSEVEETRQEVSEGEEAEETLVPEESVPAIARPLIIETLRKPVTGSIATKFGFGWSETYAEFRWNHGVGLATTQGSPVIAAYAGIVKDIVSGDPEWGTMVIMDHGSGWHTHYANISRVSVQKGQTVAEGQQLGQVGPNPPATSSSKPELYFALYKDGESQDPSELFK